MSTTALLFAQPDMLVCYDRVKYHEAERLEKVAGRTAFRFEEQDVLWAAIGETDLLFIDTLHDYDQLVQELALHASKVRQ